MLIWLSSEHVKQWWNDGDDTLEKVSLHYGNESEDVVRFILIEVNEEANHEEKSIGYFQYYFTDDETIGIDQFIGEESHIGRGIGEQAIKQFVELIDKRRHPSQIILDPSPQNRRAIRCYEKVGFKYWKTMKNENGSLAYRMKLDRAKGV